MRTQFTSPDEIVEYIMQKHEQTGAFNLGELKHIREFYEEWAIANFDVLRNLSFRHIDRMIAHGIRGLRATRIISFCDYNNEESEDE